MKIAINIPVSIGELTDKITILEIKSTLIDSKEKRKIIHDELKILTKKEGQISFSDNKDKEKYFKLKKRLYKTNLELWKIEDKIREMELKKEFKDEFIQLARSVYILNDKRSEIKNNINILTKSEIKDIKHYKDY